MSTSPPDPETGLTWADKARFRRLFGAQASRSYLLISAGMGLVAFILPILLVAVGGYDGHYSLSYFYHVDDTSRNIFVGALFSVGIFMFLFHGLSDLENWILNVAGVAALSVALNPMREIQCGDTNTAGIGVHEASAILFFLCIGVVAVFLSKGRVKYIIHPPKRRWFTAAYSLAGLAMTAMPAAVTAIQYLSQRGCESHWIFWVETTGVWAFACFWFIKTYEYRLLLGVRFMASKSGTEGD